MQKTRERSVPESRLLSHSHPEPEGTVMTIQSVRRALQILSLFSDRTPQLGVNEIASLMNLPKTTAHGLIRTLFAERYLKQDALTKKYSLGTKIHELGIFFLVNMRIRQTGKAPSMRLAEKTGYMARLAIWDRDTVLVVLNHAPEAMGGADPFQMEPRLPAYCTALGKAMLASLPAKTRSDFLEKTDFIPHTAKTQIDKSFFREEIKQVQSSGFATESEEYKTGLSCIAAPIRDHLGACTGAVSISGPPGILSAWERGKNIERLLATALEISQLMKYSA